MKSHPATKTCPRCGVIADVHFDAKNSTPGNDRFTLKWRNGRKDILVCLEDVLAEDFGCGHDG